MRGRERSSPADRPDRPSTRRDVCNRLVRCCFDIIIIIISIVFFYLFIAVSVSGALRVSRRDVSRRRRFIFTVGGRVLFISLFFFYMRRDIDITMTYDEAFFEFTNTLSTRKFRCLLELRKGRVANARYGNIEHNMYYIYLVYNT